MRSVRGAIPAEARASRSRAMAERVLALAEYVQARVVGAYVAVRSEADPAGVVARALADDLRTSQTRITQIDELTRTAIAGAIARIDQRIASDFGDTQEG